MKTQHYIQILSLLIIISFSSCKKFLDVDPPKTALIVSETFKTSESATAAVTGIYDQMKSLPESPASHAATLYAGLSSDELVNFNPDLQVSQFSNNEIIPNNGLISTIWASSYKIIGQTNSTIAGLEKSTSITDALKKQLIAESKISRALLYFYLVNLFGDVPLVLSNDWKSTQSLTRSAKSEVYIQIIKDLREAADQTPESYPNGQKTRPNKYAALALLARVYLYNNDFENAELVSSQVINSGTYALTQDLNEVFLANSSEAIWQLAPTPGTGYVTFEGNIFLPGQSTGPPDYYFTQSLMDSFEQGDERREQWMAGREYLGITYYYPFKYKILSTQGSYDEYYTILRLAEVYLIRAEASAQNGDLNGALADLNTLRERARGNSTPVNPDPLPALNLSTKADILNAVAHERRTELFAEWGNRWLDLKRTDKANEVLSAEKPKWKTNAQLYPIPQSEILLDNKLIQNPGY